MFERRQSKKREAILGLYKSTKSHPGAQWVYGQLKPRFPDLSLGTVYRNIRILCEQGALASTGVVNGEERFDGETRPHSHAVCTQCGMVMDIPEKTQVVKLDGFSIDIRNTVFYGLCNRCEAGKKKGTAAMGR